MILGIFLTSCSNIGKREEITIKEKENLIVLIEDIKNNLQKGETELNCSASFTLFITNHELNLP